MGLCLTKWWRASIFHGKGPLRSYMTKDELDSWIFWTSVGYTSTIRRLYYHVRNLYIYCYKDRFSCLDMVNTRSSVQTSKTCIFPAVATTICNYETIFSKLCPLEINYSRQNVPTVQGAGNQLGCMHSWATTGQDRRRLPSERKVRCIFTFFHNTMVSWFGIPRLGINPKLHSS